MTRGAIVLVVGLTACGREGPVSDCLDALPTATTVDPNAVQELLIAGDVGSAAGIFDPSLVYPSEAPAGFMSYSSVGAADAIRTRIAVSTDRGDHWTYLADANAPAAITVEASDPAACPGGRCSGQLVNEVSSLLFDPEDPDDGRRWKLFTHRYVVQPGGKQQYGWGHLALFTAPAPQGPWDAGRVLIGWPSAAPISTVGAAVLTTALDGMSDCVVLTEPAALWRAGAIDVAVGCAYLQNGVKIRVELLRSTDHAASFHHVATLVRADDARCLGVPNARVNAADLFMAGGRDYLLVSPEVEGSGYRGCAVLVIDDPAAGAVRRNAMGSPVVLRRLDAPPGTFNGACAYAQGATAMGYLLPMAFLDRPPRVFRVFRSGVLAP